MNGTKEKTELTKITMTVKEVAEYIGLSNSTIYNMVKLKEIPHIKVRGKILFHRVTIDNWIVNGGI